MAGLILVLDRFGKIGLKCKLMERTVVLIKPDGVKRALVGEIITRFEKVGLKIAAMKMVWVDEEIVSKHYPMSRTEWVKKIGEKTLEAYKEYGQDPGEILGTSDAEEIGRQMCRWLVKYLTSGPVLAMILEGHRAVNLVRKMAGATSPAASPPGTIRGDLSLDANDLADRLKRPILNLIHASGNAEEAKFEEELWFHESEIHSYQRGGEEIIYG